MKTIITIRGQLGSLAPEIGQLVARRMGVAYVDREALEATARALRADPEEVESKEMPAARLRDRIIQALATANPYTTSQGAYIAAWAVPLNDVRYKDALVSVIRSLADSAPIVIRGRGSQFILRGDPRTFHVLVVAPLELRVTRVSAAQRLAPDSARQEIERFDGSRRAFIRRYFDAELEDPVNHDLTINTNRLSVDEAADVVLRGARAPG